MSSYSRDEICNTTLGIGSFVYSPRNVPFFLVLSPWHHLWVLHDNEPEFYVLSADYFSRRKIGWRVVSDRVRMVADL